jgi:peptidoglycan/LPS O-acetylase OafA/YrhL
MTSVSSSNSTELGSGVSALQPAQPKGTTEHPLALLRRSRPRPPTIPDHEGRAVSDLFRPDIEGMRAVAVGLVLLYHGFHAPFTGGFVGVDVFFVISGFLITGLLLDEKARTGRISISRFYARRVRRILPAATLVTLVAVFVTYHWLGFIAGNQIADDAKWAAAFTANIHFGLLGADYLGSQLPPSPLQHMWSLGVEEQFYLVWPCLFLGVMVLVRRPRHRTALAVLLPVIIGASLAWSVIQTRSNVTWAYFSPLTRAWELGLGALVAVLAAVAARVRPSWLIELLSLCGIAGILVSALVLNSQTHYPGAAVALPVISTALLIAAGCANPRTLVGRALAVRPMQWIGARSYSLYLWHWPFLVIAAEYFGHDLSVIQNTGLILLALVATAITYLLIENPVRRAHFLATRTRLTLAIGAVLVIVTVGMAQWEIATHYGRWNLEHGDRAATSLKDEPPLAQRTYATTAQVLDAVKAARDIQTLPAGAGAQLTNKSNFAEARHATDCREKSAVPSDHFGECTYGDPHGTKLMVMYGDSHATMWGAALEGVAAKHGWRLRVFSLGGCPAPDLHFLNYATRTPYEDCDKFHDGATHAISELHPDVVIVTSIGGLLLDGNWPTGPQWQDAWISTFQKITQPGTRAVLLSDVPSWKNNDTRCVAAHRDDVQKCSAAVPDATYSHADEQLAAAAAGALYVSPQPWICTDRCEPVIADHIVYQDTDHLTQAYAEYLTGALGEALQPALGQA